MFIHLIFGKWISWDFNYPCSWLLFPKSSLAVGQRNFPVRTPQGVFEGGLPLGQLVTSVDWRPWGKFQKDICLWVVTCPPPLLAVSSLNQKDKEVKTQKRPTNGNIGLLLADGPVGCPGWQSAQRSAFPWLNFCEGAEAQSQWEPGKSGHSWWLPPRPSSLGSMKPYNHTTLISPRMEGAMANEHSLKHRNGVHYCSVSLAVAKRSVWQLFSIWILAWERKLNVECSSEGLEDGKCGWTLWIGVSVK